jgi:hypothetical protein
MDWAEAVAYLPHRMMVTDRKGRVLLLSGDIPGVKVGRSFLKMAAKEEVVVLGRAAKAALRASDPHTVDELEAIDGAIYRVVIIPFARGIAGSDHLLVTVDAPPEAPKTSLADDIALERDSVAAHRKQPPTPIPTAPPPVPSMDGPTRRPQPRPPSPGPLITGIQGTPNDMDTPPTSVSRMMRPTAPASELVVIAAGGTLPLARALAAVLGDHIKVRAWPVARLVEALRERTGNAMPNKIEHAIDPGTRLLFLGDSPFSDQVKTTSKRVVESEMSGWAIAGQDVRYGAIWIAPPPSSGIGERLGDIQFEIMELCRRAMPIGRNKKQVDPGLKMAATFLEQPAAAETHGKLREQLRQQQLVLGIARFLQDGLDGLLAS